jgi:rare lipoprotein A
MNIKRSILLAWGMLLWTWIANYNTIKTEKEIIDVLHREQWVASFYGTKKDGFIGKPMANEKQRMDPNAMTAAHRKRPFWTIVRVIENDPKTHESDTVIVEITDRWPFSKNKQWRYKRKIDLSAGAFDVISHRDKWHTKVIIEVLQRGEDNQ